MIDQHSSAHVASTDAHPATRQPPEDAIISDVSGWVLRVGVVISAIVMLTGIVISFIHGNVTLDRIQHDGFDYSPVHIFHGICRASGKSIIEAGIYILLFTPILRVFASSILFAFEERDWLYTVITILVLIMTLSGLLWLS